MPPVKGFSASVLNISNLEIIITPNTSFSETEQYADSRSDEDKGMKG